MIFINSISGQIHDLGYGGYPYKVVVTVSLPVSVFNKMCPKFKQSACRNLGSLVLDVNNAVFRLNPNIPAHNPSIDSQGSKRAKNGIKTLEFVYFFKDHDRAANLGFSQLKLKNGDILPKYNQYVDLNPVERLI